MFTGIITHLGKLKQKKDATFTFTADKSILKKLETGTSIAVNGVCLTVLEKPKGDTFSIDAMPETIKKTTLGDLTENALVNLELPATADTFLSGHIVQGHVDAKVKILSIVPEGNSHIFTFALPKEISKYVVDKGSITVNGISLTVIKANSDSFTVGIIPHTWDHTMLNNAKAGDYVTIETDVFAKYVERLLKK
jgi:riboflavin synthase